MRDKTKSVRNDEPASEPVYARIDAADLAELQRRQLSTGATVSAQIRVIVREALRKKVIR